MKETSRKAFQYRLYPTHQQQTLLSEQLEACRTLYNSALDERRSAYHTWERANKGITFTQLDNGLLLLQMQAIRPDAPKPPQISYHSQANQLKEIRQGDLELAKVNFSATQDVLRRVEKAFNNFFKRVKRGEIPGYPRFKAKGRYHSITWPSYGDGCKLKASGKLYIQNVGEIRFKQHRNIQGNIKTITIRKDGSHWYVSFSCQYEYEVEAHPGPAVGVDVGIEYFVSLSDGTQIENPRFYHKAEKRLAKAQRKLSKLRQLPYKNPRKRKARKAVALTHKKIRNQRQDFAHKLSGELAKRYSVIFVEDLQVKNLARRAKPKLDEIATQEQGRAVYAPNGARAKSGLSKSITDAGWSTFINILTSKAEEAGGKVIEVGPAGTSGTCPQCGHYRKKSLSERWHECECGASMPRDVAAAKVIMGVGLHSLGLSLEAVGL